MTLSTKAEQIVSEINHENIKMGDIKKLAKGIKRDHDLALELWSTGKYHPRLLSVLILDKKFLTQEMIEQFAADMLAHDPKQRNQITDWLLANQLTKSKKTTALITTWEDHSSPVLRRLFWYHQGRLRWTGKAPPVNNSAMLLDSLENQMANDEPEVQWAMNFCACFIGLHEPDFRARCIDLGETVGLYKGDPVPRHCAPNYLPEFIQYELDKRHK